MRAWRRCRSRRRVVVTVMSRASFACSGMLEEASGRHNDIGDVGSDCGCAMRIARVRASPLRHRRASRSGPLEPVEELGGRIEREPRRRRGMVRPLGLQIVAALDSGDVNLGLLNCWGNARHDLSVRNGVIAARATGRPTIPAVSAPVAIALLQYAHSLIGNTLPVPK